MFETLHFGEEKEMEKVEERNEGIEIKSLFIFLVGLKNDKRMNGSL